MILTSNSISVDTIRPFLRRQIVSDTESNSIAAAAAVLKVFFQGKQLKSDAFIFLIIATIITGSKHSAFELPVVQMNSYKLDWLKIRYSFIHPTMGTLGKVHENKLVVTFLPNILLLL